MVLQERVDSIVIFERIVLLQDARKSAILAYAHLVKNVAGRAALNVKIES